MATLEMVPLRSKYPSSGRMTLRFTVPKFGTVPYEESADFDLDAALLEVMTDSITSQTTTPQVATVETAAGKGGQAR